MRRPEIRVEDGPAALGDVLSVSRETIDRLQVYAALVEKWQRSDNLVAPATLPHLWRRHIADSLQLLALFPDDKRWLDLGSGAGFPGLVLACTKAGTDGFSVDLVESNVRKCAFLRAVIRETAVPATVYQGRIETVLSKWDKPIDRVTARALAPLDRLLNMAEPILSQGVPAAFLKGRDYQQEIEDASQTWSLDLIDFPSRITEEGRIVDIRAVSRRK